MIYVIAGSHEEYRAWVDANAFESRAEFRYVGSLPSSEGIRRTETFMCVGTWEQHADKRKLYESLRARGCVITFPEESSL